MRFCVHAIVAITVTWLAAMTPARAGIYISAELRPVNEYRLNFIKATRSTLQSLALPPRPGDTDREQYLKLLAPLEAKAKANELSDIDRADLGGLYLRFGRPRDAVRVLSAGNSRHFLVLCNLAVANHELAVQDQDVNRLEEAVLTQRRALAAWPWFWEGWSYEQWYVFRRVERVQLRLLELRLREMRLADGKQPVWQTTDELFPGFKAADLADRYQAGRVPFAALDLLPPDAAWLVRELLLTYPTDGRLYWLFGELLNAGGRVEDALQVLDDLVNVNQLSNIRALTAHRRVLLERVSLLRDLRKTEMFRSDVEATFLRAARAGQGPLTQEELLWALAPRGSLTMPGLGFAAAEAGGMASIAALRELRHQERLNRPPDPPTLPATLAGGNPQSTPGGSTGGLPDWRTLASGFGAGVLVAVIFSLQRKEWRRRRQAISSRRQSIG